MTNIEFTNQIMQAAKDSGLRRDEVLSCLAEAREKLAPTDTDGESEAEGVLRKLKNLRNMSLDWADILLAEQGIDWEAIKCASELMNMTIKVQEALGKVESFPFRNIAFVKGVEIKEDVPAKKKIFPWD